MLKQLTVEKLNKKIGPKTILKDISLTVNAGELVVITGPNGSGKTTLLRILAGMMPGTSGEIHWDDRSFSVKETDLLRGIGLLGHRPMVYDSLTAFENLKFFSKMYGLKGSKIRIGEMLRWVGLNSYKYERVENFSHGMRQRLALARMLIHAPVLLLYDEPFTGLDAEGQRLLTGTLKAMQAEGRMQILTTHNPDELHGLNYREIKLIAGTLAAGQRVREETPGPEAEGIKEVVQELAAIQEVAGMTRKSGKDSGYRFDSGKDAANEVCNQSVTKISHEASEPIDAHTIAEAWKLAREKAERLSAQASEEATEPDYNSTGLRSLLNQWVPAIFTQIKKITGLGLHNEEKLPQEGITVEEFLRKQESEEVSDTKNADVERVGDDQKTVRLTVDASDMPKLHENVFLTKRLKGNPLPKKGSSQIPNRGRMVRRNTLREQNPRDEKRDKS